MTISQIIGVRLPSFLGWTVLPVALGFGGGGGGQVVQQATPATPTPPTPPAPPEASSATVATRALVRDIASRRSRSTTVLTRDRTHLTPGSTSNFSTILGNNFFDIPTTTATPPPFVPFVTTDTGGPSNVGLNPTTNTRDLPPGSPTGTGTVITEPTRDPQGRIPIPDVPAPSVFMPPANSVVYGGGYRGVNQVNKVYQMN